VVSNGTVQAKTWNPNGLAAVVNLPCRQSTASDKVGDKDSHLKL
jgi:hypothetical protein